MVRKAQRRMAAENYSAWSRSALPIHLRRIAHAARLIVRDTTTDLFLAVHDEGTVGIDRLVQRPAAKDQEVLVLDPDRIAGYSFPSRLEFD